MLAHLWTTVGYKQLVMLRASLCAGSAVLEQMEHTFDYSLQQMFGCLRWQHLQRHESNSLTSLKIGVPLVPVSEMPVVKRMLWDHNNYSKITVACAKQHQKLKHGVKKMPPPTTKNSPETCLRDCFHDLRAGLHSSSLSSQPNRANRIHGYQSAIDTWLGTLTPSQQLRRYALSELVMLAQLKGTSGKPPADRDVSAALERCGFISMRDWTIAGRNRRQWVIKKGT